MSMLPCPADSTKRSRLMNLGFLGLNRRCLSKSAKAVGAMPMGIPGWPLDAFSTASMARKRIVLTHVSVKGSPVLSCSLGTDVVAASIRTTPAATGRRVAARPPPRRAPAHADRAGQRATVEAAERTAVRRPVDGGAATNAMVSGAAEDRERRGDGSRDVGGGGAGDRERCGGLRTTAGGRVCICEWQVGSGGYERAPDGQPTSHPPAGEPDTRLGGCKRLPPLPARALDSGSSGRVRTEVPMEGSGKAQQYHRPCPSGDPPAKRRAKECRGETKRPFHAGPGDANVTAVGSARRWLAGRTSRGACMHLEIQPPDLQVASQ